MTVSTRATKNRPLSKQEKLRLLTEYAAHYRDAVVKDDTALNLKIQRDAFTDLLDRVGMLIADESARLATAPGPVSEFLGANPLPEGMAPLLPVSFRAFCLALNSLKQWVAKEQAATGRYLLGGCRANCVAMPRPRVLSQAKRLELALNCIIRYETAGRRCLLAAHAM